jgi:hypothetical protein
VRRRRAGDKAVAKWRSSSAEVPAVAIGGRRSRGSCRLAALPGCGQAATNAENCSNGTYLARRTVPTRRPRQRGEPGSFHSPTAPLGRLYPLGRALSPADARIEVPPPMIVADTYATGTDLSEH